MLLSVLIQFIILGSSIAVPPGTSKKFRMDYEYNRKTDAFYKLHIESVNSWLASRKCVSEGATLMVPVNEEDIRQLHKMMKMFPDIKNVLIGNDNRDHESAEETPIINLEPSSDEENNHNLEGTRCEIVNQDGDILSTFCFYEHRPFVCKVDAKDVLYNEQCGVYDIDYKYYDNVKSCYKLFTSIISWGEAYSECREQGAHLLVLNSKAESDTIKEYISTISHGTYISAGIREDKSNNGTHRVFKTIFNETMEAAGFNEWSPGEPNNWRNDESCGSITQNGKYNDVPCWFPLNYICEKEVVPK